MRRLIEFIRNLRTQRLINSKAARMCNANLSSIGYTINRAECTPDKVVWSDKSGQKIVLS